MIRSICLWWGKKPVTLLLLLMAFLSLTVPVSAQRGKKDVKVDSLQERKSIQARTEFFNAIKEKNIGQLDEAVNGFRKSVALDPENDAAYYEIARIMVSKGNLIGALENAKKALAINKDNLYYKSLNADINLQLGKTKDALKIYQSIIEQDKENIDAYLAIASIYEAQKNYNEANKYYSLVERQTGVVYEILQQKINNYITARNFSQAIDELKKLIESYPDEYQFQEILADLYGYNNQPELAVSTLNNILKQSPNYGNANLKLAKISIAQNKITESIQYAKTAFSNSEISIDLKMELMFIYFELSNQKKDILTDLEELGQLISLSHPSDAKGYAVWGDVLNSNGKYAEARNQYKKAVKIAADKQLIWQEIVSIDSRLSMIDSIIVDSQQGIDLFPSIPFFYYFNAIGHLQQKHYQEATQSLEAGLALVVDNDQLAQQFYAALGDCFNGLKDYKKSDENYEKALKINPNDTYVLNNYSYFLSLREEKLERAKEMAELVNKLEPNQPNYQDTYAWVLFKLKKYEEAKTWLQKAIDSGGNSSEMLEHYGDIQYVLGNVSLALEYWTKAKNTGETSPDLEKKILEKRLPE